MSEYYTTTGAIQEQLMKETPESVPDPTTLEYTNFINYLKNQLIPDVSRYIDNYTHRFFVPLYSTENYYNRVLFSKDALEDYSYYYNVPKQRLSLPTDLLEIVSYTSTATLISSDEYRIVGTPAYAVDLDRDSNDFDFDTSAFANAQVIVGWSGYHTDWNNAFATVESITVDNSATSITVAASTLYSFPQYVRCEDELMLVTALPDGTSLTVTRAVRGTTIAAHTDKALSIYKIDDSLHIAATRMVAWLYNNRVSQGNVVQISGTAVVLDQLPTMVKDTLDRLEKRGAV